MFQKATKKKAKLRLAIDGPAGAGKTYTALRMARGLLEEGKRIRVIDSERGSASKYADKFDFDVAELAPPYSVERYSEFVTAAARDPDTGVLVVDSFSHLWAGEGGVLDTVDAMGGDNKFGKGWRKVSPMHARFIDTILAAPCHVIVTMRSKMEYAQEKDQNGRTVIRKVGLKPVAREGVEYEFDLVLDLDQDHNATASKSRYSGFADKVFRHPGEEQGQELKRWLSDGVEAPPAPAPSPTTTPAASAPDPWAQIQDLLAKYVTPQDKPLSPGQTVKAATGKTKPGQLEADDVAKVAAELERLVSVGAAKLSAA